MTKKLSLIRDNHILEADFRGSLCEITIIEIKDQGQSQKYLAKFDVEL
jgi:hypothetical protein